MQNVIKCQENNLLKYISLFLGGRPPLISRRGGTRPPPPALVAHAQTQLHRQLLQPFHIAKLSSVPHLHPHPTPTPHSPVPRPPNPPRPPPPPPPPPASAASAGPVSSVRRVREARPGQPAAVISRVPEARPYPCCQPMPRRQSVGSLAINHAPVNWLSVFRVRTGAPRAPRRPAGAERRRRRRPEGEEGGKSVGDGWEGRGGGGGEGVAVRSGGWWMSAGDVTRPSPRRGRTLSFQWYDLSPLNICHDCLAIWLENGSGPFFVRSFFRTTTDIDVKLCIHPGGPILRYL